MSEHARKDRRTSCSTCHQACAVMTCAHTRPLESLLLLHLRRQQRGMSFVLQIGDSQRAHTRPAVEDDWLTDFCWWQASWIFLGDLTRLLWRLTLVLLRTELTLLITRKHICITIKRLIDIRQRSYLRLCFRFADRCGCLVPGDTPFVSGRRQAAPVELTQNNSNNRDADWSSSCCSCGEINAPMPWACMCSK